MCCAQDTKKPTGNDPFSSDEMDLMAEDMREYGAEVKAAGGAGAQQQDSASSSGLGAGLKDVVDKVLIADFFFILFIMAWFAAGLGQRTAAQSSALLDTWYALWPTVFQPALGVLMLGALVSGLTGHGKDAT